MNGGQRVAIAIPLDRAVLCADCSHIFNIEDGECVCGSHTWMPVSKSSTRRVFQ